MKLSEMSMDHLAEWCHVRSEDPRLPTAWDAAKSSILGYTGLDESAANEFDELTIAAIALTSDMIYNPTMHVDNDNLNRVVGSFIGLHNYNLLPGGTSNPQTSGDNA